MRDEPATIEFISSSLNNDYKTLNNIQFKKDNNISRKFHVRSFFLFITDFNCVVLSCPSN